MLGGKFSKQLTTSKRKWLTELRESDTSLGGWNADASHSDRPMGDMAEILNLRKMRPGELETRSGFKQWQFQELSTTPPVAGQSVNKVPLSKCEYRLDEIFVDVTIYAEAGSLYALILHPELPDSDANQSQVVPILTGNFTKPMAWCYQYGTFLVVSFIDDAALAADKSTGVQMYALTPTAGTSPKLITWTVLDVGKAVCPTPSGVTFSATATGKLLCYVPSSVIGIGTTGMTTSGLACTGYQKDAITSDFVVKPLDIQAPYFLADTGAFSAFTQPRWKFNTKDPVGGDVSTTTHLKSRGWLYRFVFKRKFLDVRGDEIIVTSAPSADIYAEDRIYCPPVDAITMPSGAQVFPREMCIEYQNLPAFPPIVPAKTGMPPRVAQDISDTSWTNGIPLPTLADFKTLRDKFISACGTIQVHDDLLYPTAVALGAADEHPDFNFEFEGGSNPEVVTRTITILGRTFPASIYPGLPPYKLNASSFEISECPNAIINWADFGTLSADTYAIDVYRTAYCYPDPKESDRKGTGYQPYRYGYAGTIKKNGTFTDTIKDSQLLFDETPENYEGYLVGQFAGEVMRPYQAMMVQGNTRTKAWLRNPWSGIQAVGYFNGLTAGTGVSTNAIVQQYGGKSVLSYYYAYADADKKLSNAVPLTVDTTPITSGSVIGINADASVNFLFPRGYSASIESVAVIASLAWDTSTSLPFNPSTGNPTNVTQLYYIQYIPVADGVLIDAPFADGVSMGAKWAALTPAPTINSDGTLALRDIRVSTDPGAIIWSKPNNLWSWPQENFNNIHDQDPITALDEVIGPLYVLSDKGVVMTREGPDGAFSYVEPVMTSQTGTGCISKYACVKVANRVFFMSSFGMMFVEGSGIVQFPANIQTVIRDRLQEKIPGSPQLSGVRNRVSLSFMTNRQEFWLTFPATAGYPQRTFIIKLYDKGATSSLHSGWSQPTVFAYEFDLATLCDPAFFPLDWLTRSSPNPQGVVIHCPHMDGSMFSAFEIPSQTIQPSPLPCMPKVGATAYPAKMIVQDNDRADIEWPGMWAMQYQHSVESPSTAKQIFTWRMVASSTSAMSLVTGMLSDTYDRCRGTINATNAIRPLVTLIASANQPVLPNQPVIAGGARQLYSLPISGSLLETSGDPPAIRLVGKPGSDGRNRFEIEAFDIYYGYLHAHKGD